MNKTEKTELKDLAIWGAGLATGISAEWIAGEFIALAKNRVKAPIYYLGSFGIMLAVGTIVNDQVQRNLHSIFD